jgi:tetratricopeptide (TPR) repeat protein
MLTRFTVARMSLVVGLAVSLTACSQFQGLKAKKLFRDANTAYSRQDYRQAAATYEEVLASDPTLTTAYFYLGNSYDNLYKPSRIGEADNDALLDKAIENYKQAADKETDPQLRQLALEYLVAAYGPDKKNDPGQAEPIVQQMIEIDPNEPANYFVLAKIYEDSGLYDDAASTLLRAKEVRPNDAAVYLQLAGYYNRQGEFEQTIEALQQRANIEPDNPSTGHSRSRTITARRWSTRTSCSVSRPTWRRIRTRSRRSSPRPTTCATVPRSSGRPSRRPRRQPSADSRFPVPAIL